MDIREALAHQYDRHAHFTPAIVPGLDRQPRFIGSNPSILKELRFEVIVLDIDTGVGKQHVKATPAWWDHCVTTIRAHVLGNALMYATSRGLRVVYRLAKAKTLMEYLQTHRRLVAAFKGFLYSTETHRIIVDKLEDWGRCYGLPFVVRDGARQELPAWNSEDFTLDESLLPAQEVAEIVVEQDPTMDDFDRIAVGSTLTDFKLEGVKAWDTIGRNQTLYRVASAIRDFRWMDLESLETMILALNANSFDEPLPDNEVRKLVMSAWERYKPTKGELTIEEEVVADLAAPEEKDSIAIRTGFFDEAQAASIKSLRHVKNIFVREGKLVRIVNSEIQPLPKDSLKAILVSVGIYTKFKADKDGSFTEVPAEPSADLVAGVYAAGEYPLGELKGILRTPTLRPDGTVVTEWGYDKKTQLFNDLTMTIDESAIGNTKPQAEIALTRLKAIFAEFPFGAEGSYSTTLAALMTPILRTAIAGPVPLFLFDSHTPGSGKTIQADIVSIIATGREAPRMSLTKEEEFEKRVTAILETGAPVVLIDNIRSGSALGGPSLDALLTSDRWMGRTLGRSQMTVLPNLAVWMATGNNLRVEGDLARRSLRSYLNPKEERPEERTFAITDLRAYALQHRTQIVTDILTIASARHASGFKGPSMGSFERWSYWVRDALVWLGEVDPVVSQHQLRESDQTGAWLRFLEASREIFGDAPFAASDIHDMQNGIRRNAASSDAYAAIKTSVSELVKDPQSLSQIAGLLRTWHNRTLGGLRLVTLAAVSMRGVQYTVKVAGDQRGLLRAL